jgi:hypothetical protein
MTAGFVENMVGEVCPGEVWATVVPQVDEDLDPSDMGLDIGEAIAPDGLTT